MSRLARLFALVAVPAAVVTLAGPASAATVTEDRALTAAEVQSGAYTLACPSGERIVSASASFYRTAKHKNPLGADLAPITTTSDANSNPVAATWTLPKGAKYVQATLVCEPIPPTFQTVSFSGTFVAGQTVRVDCPAATPYLWSVLQVDAIDPSTGQPVPLGYAYVHPTGIEVYPSYPGWTWQIAMTCTNQPPA
jgi:hypothetical protein